MTTTERYIWVGAVCLVIGFSTYQGCDRKAERERHAKDIEFLTASLTEAQSLKCDTIYDTAWLPAKPFKPHLRPPVSVTEVTPPASVPCPPTEYYDTIPFDGVDIAYYAKVNGTFEELALSPQIHAPQIIKVPVPCPPAPVAVQMSRWSVNVMAGLPACGYLGGQYDLSDNIGLTAGAFVSPKSVNALVGVRIRAKK